MRRFSKMLCAIATAATLTSMASLSAQDLISEPVPPAPEPGLLLVEETPVEPAPIEMAPAPESISATVALPEIIPAAKMPSPGSMMMQMPVIEGQPIHSVDQSEYQRIYRSIPFSRAEYKANPSYRHDSTMEIMTGNPRHQTIVRHNHEHKQPVRPVPAPARPSRIIPPVFGGGTPWMSPAWFRGHTW